MSNSINNISKVDLAVASANLDGIQFNNIQRSGYNSTTQYVRANTPWSTLNASTPLKPAVNAVDIDWNEAVIPYGNLETGGSATVNSTGELLSLISRMQQEIFELSATVTALNNNAVTKGSDGSMAMVTVYVSSGGRVTINGNTYESGDNLYYRVGTVIDVVAIPDSGYKLNYWRLNGQTVDNNILYDRNKFSIAVDNSIDINLNVDFTSTDLEAGGGTAPSE